MVLIHILQRFSAAVSARDAAAMVVLAAALGVAASAYFRAPSALRQHRFALGAVALGALVLVVVPRGWLPAPVMVGLALAVVAGFSLHTIADPRNGEDNEIEGPVSHSGNRIWIGAASIVALFFLLTDLGGYAGSLMVWEPEAMTGLVEASQAGTSLPRFAVARLLWDEGLVSSSHHSFLWGSGTYALWRFVGVSPMTLRLMSVFLAIACLPVVFAVGKRVGGPCVATAGLVVISINPVLIFYGRYGASITATLFAVLLVLLACERLVDPGEDHWWLGLAAAGAIFLGTLGYSPGRVVTVVLVTTTFLVGALSWRRLARGRRLSVALMVIVLAGVGLAQVVSGTAGSFVSARGEHAFALSEKPEMVEQFLDEQADPKRLTPHQRLIFTGNMIANGLSGLKSALSFSIMPMESAWHVLGRDPPDLPLIQGPLVLFALWGFVRALADWRRGWPILLVAALAGASLPLLLTNRVDIHRLSLASLPLVVSASLGVVAANRVAHACGISIAVRHVVAAALFVLVAANNSTFLFYAGQPRRSFMTMRVQSEIDSISDPVVVGLVCDHRSAGEIRLALVDRQRLDHVQSGEFLSDEMVDALTDKERPDEKAVILIEEMLDRAAVILAPRGPFEKAVSVLEARGVQVLSFGDLTGGWWRIDRVSNRDIGVIDRPDWPRMMDGHGPATLDRALQPRIPLTYAHLRDVKYGFKAPRFDFAYDGKPITMGGVTYGVGIGMHAWTRMQFVVPEGVVAFEGIIGLSDTASDCDRTAVTFEVWTDDDRRIFASGPFSEGTPPRRIRVPLDATATVELVLTEGGNGHDCDQGNWAAPFFILGR
jgi:hypothetical protein